MEPRPSVIVFDVNGTLSDMAPLAGRFAEVGAPGLLARVWFAALLRDGFEGVAILRRHGLRLVALAAVASAG